MTSESTPPLRARTSQVLQVMLGEQLKFLEISSKAFDEGFEPEAKRLATTLRVMLHDTTHSKSLLRQLGIKEDVEWVTTVAAHNPKNLLPTRDYMFYRTDSTGVSLKPILGEGPLGLSLPKMNFSIWWNQTVHVENGHQWNRKDFVLWLSNKEGGAHVDPGVDPLYEDVATAIARTTRMVTNVYDELGTLKDVLVRVPEANSVLVGVRQVAFEVIETFAARSKAGIFP